MGRNKLGEKWYDDIGYRIDWRLFDCKVLFCGNFGSLELLEIFFFSLINKYFIRID